ncbi:MAG TPA: helix-turn-helix domain-containing protein [Drouetiella sp.]
MKYDKLKRAQSVSQTFASIDAQPAHSLTSASSPVLLTQEQVAQMFGVSAKWVERKRSEGGGPAYVKLGTGLRAPVRYNLQTVVAWFESQERSNTSEQH